jgi:hypothetical protein
MLATLWIGLKPVENQKDVGMWDDESTAATTERRQPAKLPRLKKKYKMHKIDIFYSLQEIVFITTSQMWKKKWCLQRN